MKDLFLKFVFGLGSVVIIFLVSVLIVVVRLIIFFSAKQKFGSAEDDIFHDSRKHPLPVR